MKRLMSDEEMRGKLEDAFEAGYALAYFHDGRSKYEPEFDEWYDGVYGGPDCE